MSYFSRRELLKGASAAAILIAQPHLAEAWTHGSSNNLLTAKTLIGGFDGNGNSFAFMNMMKLALGPASTMLNYPSVLDSNGYPTSVTLSADIGNQVFLPTSYGTGQWVLKWTGQGSFFIGSGAPINIVSNSGGTITGNQSFNMGVAGTSPRVVFTFTNGTPSALSWAFPSGGIFGTMSNLVLCRLADEASITAGGIFNPDFISQLKALNPLIIRTLQWANVTNSNPATRFSYRFPTTAFSFVNLRWPPECWAGTAAGTDTYTCSAPSGWAGLVDGTTVQAVFTNANTSTTPTLNVAGTGAITIQNVFASALFAGDIAASSRGTLAYNLLLNSWIFRPEGITSAVPVEYHVALANAVNSNLWYNISHRYGDSDAASLATYVRANLNSGLSCYFEFGNEVWNNSFNEWQYANASGVALGFPNSSIRGQYGWYGLRVRQMMAAITTAWGANPGLKRVMAFSAVAAGTSLQTVDTFQFQGTDLSTALGYTKYNSFVGVSYTAVGQRPIDFCDVLSYATYYCGAQCTNFDVNYSNAGGTGLTTGHPSSGPGSTIAGLLGAADVYAAGGATNITNALAWLDWDFRQGTNNGAAGGETLLALNSSANLGLGATGFYPAWETMGAKYSLPIVCYEGGLEAAAPSTSECTTLGISTTYGGAGGKIDNLLTAYKNSSLFQQLVTDQYQQFLGTKVGDPNFGLLPHSKAPAWFVLQGPSQWSMLPGDTYTGPLVGSSQFKSWDATVALNH